MYFLTCFEQSKASVLQSPHALIHKSIALSLLFCCFCFSSQSGFVHFHVSDCQSYDSFYWHHQCGTSHASLNHSYSKAHQVEAQKVHIRIYHTGKGSESGSAVASVVVVVSTEGSHTVRFWCWRQTSFCGWNWCPDSRNTEVFSVVLVICFCLGKI